MADASSHCFRLFWRSAIMPIKATSRNDRPVEFSSQPGVLYRLLPFIFVGLNETKRGKPNDLELVVREVPPWMQPLVTTYLPCE